MILFSLTVEIRVQIYCATKPNPHSRLETSETVVITGQGTQACGDELVITGTSGRTPQDTQDTQGRSHEMVVTSGTRESVEPVASAGLPLAGRTESVEEAGVGTDAARNAQGVLNYIAHRYFQTVDTTQPEERNEFLRYLEDVRKVLVLDPKSGSLIVTVM